ncbi:hypothetical protein EJ08DRAFT_692984 [Tothia fuscella]|uniref:Uncharacterized protein n=1 Tax=Tothia fuscella TaxID=1048955 RepID=A0A9P4P0E2_9PEZI|nr:hypothetical protein EJ08DRAFT_692984 [Tothia fuscella]
MSTDLAYLAFPFVYMRPGEHCNLETISNQLLSMRPNELSSLDPVERGMEGHNLPRPLNFADFATPFPLSILGTRFCDSQKARCHVDILAYNPEDIAKKDLLLQDSLFYPRLVLPSSLTELQAHWKSCTIATTDWRGAARDPPVIHPIATAINIPTLSRSTPSPGGSPPQPAFQTAAAMIEAPITLTASSTHAQTASPTVQSITPSKTSVMLKIGQTYHAIGGSITYGSDGGLTLLQPADSPSTAKVIILSTLVNPTTVIVGEREKVTLHPGIDGEAVRLDIEPIRADVQMTIDIGHHISSSASVATAKTKGQDPNPGHFDTYNPVGEGPQISLKPSLPTQGAKVFLSSQPEQGAASICTAPSLGYLMLLYFMSTLI